MSHTPSDNVDAKLKAAEDHLREVMLALPEVTEEFPWGHRTAKVKGKMFAILTLDNDGLGVTTKLPESSEAALTLPFTEPTGYGLGKSGWVSSRFKPGSEVPVGLLSQWIHESFRAVAPRKVLDALRASSAPAPAAAAAKKAPAASRPVVAAKKARAASSAAAAKKPRASGSAAGGRKAVAGTSASRGARPLPGRPVGAKKTVAKQAPARKGPSVRAGAKTSAPKRGSAGTSRSKRR